MMAWQVQDAWVTLKEDALSGSYAPQGLGKSSQLHCEVPMCLIVLLLSVLTNVSLNFLAPGYILSAPWPSLLHVL